MEQAEKIGKASVFQTTFERRCVPQLFYTNGPTFAE